MCCKRQPDGPPAESWRTNEIDWSVAWATGATERSFLHPGMSFTCVGVGWRSCISRATAIEKAARVRPAGWRVPWTSGPLRQGLGYAHFFSGNRSCRRRCLCEEGSGSRFAFGRAAVCLWTLRAIVHTARANGHRAQASCAPLGMWVKRSTHVESTS